MSLSLDNLDASKACDKPFEFEHINALGEPTGVFLRVLGAQSEQVTTEVAVLINSRRQKEATREMQRRLQPGLKGATFEPLESDVEFGVRLAAVRLVGWRGPGETEGLTPEQVKRFQDITDPWTPANAMRLCRSHREIAAAVTLQSETMGNFTPV